MMPRVMVIGLDGLPWPTWKRVVRDSPFLSGGAGGPLLSCRPPVTIPAWAVAATGRTPGEIGLYGLRVPEGPGFGQRLARPDDIRAEPIWEGLPIKTALIGFPPGYPPGPGGGGKVSKGLGRGAEPPSPSPSWRVACFLAPPGGAWASPASLQSELQAVVGDYIPDILYRRGDPEAAIREARAMAAARFRIAAHIARTRPWDLLWLVEMGSDRLQHALGPGHPAVEEHARFVIECVEALAAEHPDATLLLMSDHGSETARGVFALNDWLRSEGYLGLREEPAPGADVTSLADPARTSAWAWGGYWGKVFVDGARATLRDDIADALEALRGPPGFHLRVHRPEELYPVCRGRPPGLFVEPAPGWRVGGTVGHSGLFLDRNDTGPDGAVHSPEGFFHLADPQGRGSPCLRSLTDVAPFLKEVLAG